MTCLKCDKNINTLICPYCKFDNSNIKLIAMIKKCKELLAKKDYTSAEKTLINCIKLTKGTAKEQGFKNELNKLRELAAKSLPEKKIEDAREEKLKEPAAKSANYFLIEDETLRKTSNKPEYRYIYLKLAILIIIAGFSAFYFFPEQLKTIKNYFTSTKTVKRSVDIKKSVKRDITIKSKEMQKVTVIPRKGEVMVRGRIIDKVTSFPGTDKTIITKEKSEAVIKLDKSYAVLENESKLRIDRFDKKDGKVNTKLNLNIGQVFFKIKKLNKEEKFSVVTPAAVVGVRGTKFIIESDGIKSSVHCDDGKVEVYSRKLKKKVLLEKGLSVNASPFVDKLNALPTPESVRNKFRKYDRILIDSVKHGIFKKTGYKIEEKKELVKQKIKSRKKTSQSIGFGPGNEEKSGEEKVVKKKESKKTDKSETSAEINEQKEKDTGPQTLYDYVEMRYKEKYGEKEGKEHFKKDIDSFKKRKEEGTARPKKGLNDFQKDLYKDASKKFKSDNIKKQLKQYK